MRFSHTVACCGVAALACLGTMPALAETAEMANTYVFSVLGNNTYGLTDGRRVQAYLSLDF